MKIFINWLILAIFLFSTINILAQSERPSVWAVDFIKVKDGEQENYRKFIEQNWAKARSFMKDKGIVNSFQFISISSSKDNKWDSLLITEYINQEGFEKRETVFEEYRKNNSIVLVNEKTSRDMSEIKLSKNFSNSFSEKVGEMMLKTQNADLEDAAVRIPLENYLQGHATGNSEFHQKAFYPESRLLFVRDGKLMQRTSAEYIKGSGGKPAADESSRKRWIEMVDITGNAAIGKIILDYPTSYIVDYFALLKIDGEWKIVNKSFHSQPRSNQAEKVSFTTTDEEKKAIAVPLENYLKTQATGNGDFIRKAFDAETKVMFFSNGKYTQLSTDEFAARFNGKPAADEANRKRSFEIIDVAGNAAIAKVTLDYPNVKFTDYMTLLKIDGEWKIINKTFYADSKA